VPVEARYIIKKGESIGSIANIVICMISQALHIAGSFAASSNFLLMNFADLVKSATVIFSS
jgi:hypothetical protein